ncbi:hypothetical protein KQX54_014534 [Cotesia glomerata]|uniref:Uncharacterized protein n=1 Tax=Cotesia glomerata TaxID=32391 RepID=A0AAV7J512_COTGL|nr:hypothetical protein KQX54_014534 [Cotesia glomerata]
MNRGGNHYDPKRPLGIDDQFIEHIITVVREGYFNYSEFRLRGPPNMASLLEFKAAILVLSNKEVREEANNYKHNNSHVKALMYLNIVSGKIDVVTETRVMAMKALTLVLK